MTNTSYLYCGEQFDSDLGFYFLRARYMNPTSGRFFTMDEFEGEESEPKTLHKYCYTANSPVDYSDPSGYVYTPSNKYDRQGFGYAIEPQIQSQYENDFVTNKKPSDVVTFGKWFRKGPFPIRLKPDILNHTTRQFMDIKPFSISGIRAGVETLVKYGVFRVFGYTPDTSWTPKKQPLWALGRAFVVFNLGGILYYVDVNETIHDVGIILALSMASMRIGAAARIVFMGMATTKGVRIAHASRTVTFAMITKVRPALRF